ncbi:Myb-like domain-containing protein [Dioscorea alata]|uniref:Myb-like domain-containing protein n=1 Tax=Dioscorea alata TaxID=55571 RepID=A0ACB7URS1_DIOAL|nr:Myb-like domain-containing protein [Dioscorea alata]
MDMSMTHHQYHLPDFTQLLAGPISGVQTHFSGAPPDVVLLSSQPQPQSLTTGSGFVFGEERGGSSQPRWPRQETLTLLEIRSRLDHKFREASQKAPLWDEVSRIMAEEYGYQRSGKKCREKLENLYKYYKKTKEGKAGKQEGKHYRFFRQLEALYGEKKRSIKSAAVQAPPTILADQSLSFSSSTEYRTSSTDGDFEETIANLSEKKERKKHKRSGRKSWRLKLKECLEQQVRRLMELQEAWLQKMMRTLEQMEQERNLREEMWRKQEAARLDREQRDWASERAWMEARDAALITALENIGRRESK